MSSISFGQVSLLIKKLEKIGWGPKMVTKLGQAPLETWKQIEDLLSDNKLKSAMVYLQPLFSGKKISLPATKGTVTIADASDVFTGFIDPDFENWGTNKPGHNTRAMEAQVFEMSRHNGTFAKFFGSLGELDKLEFTQGQIVEFCRTHRDKLRQDGYGTFFLFKVGEERFVAYVYVDYGLLEVSVSHFSSAVVWDADSQHRVVVPQLTA